MKPIEITYTPTPFLIVIVPEGAKKVELRLMDHFWLIVWDEFGAHPIKSIPLPPGHYGTPFLVSEATEEQVNKLVEFVDCNANGASYRNYAKESRYSHLNFTALESLHSILEKENIYFKNKYGEKEPVRGDKETEAEYLVRHLAWHSFQQRVFRPEQVVIIPILNK